MHIDAYLITEEHLDSLTNLTGFDKPTLSANLGWVVVIERSYNPKRYVVPPKTFQYEYPQAELYKFYQEN